MREKGTNLELLTMKNKPWERAKFYERKKVTKLELLTMKNN